MKCRIADSKTLRKKCSEAVFALSPVSVLSILFVGETKLQFGYDKLRKLADKVNDRYDDISSGYLTFDDLKECLISDNGVEIPYEIKYRPTHTIDDAIRNAEYTQKAFATAVFASVLCDKFLFGKVKTQQAVKWLEKTFDTLKDRPQIVKELQRRYFCDYEVQVR